MRTKRVSLGWLVMIGWILLPIPAIAGLESPGYEITDSGFSGGAGNLNSSGYALREGIIDFAAKNEQASANYHLEAVIGIQGLSNLAAITSLTPMDFARYFTEEDITLTVNALDPDNDPLQYQAKQDGVLKAGPQTSNVLTWSLNVSDQGRHTLTAEVLDAEGTASASRDVYVYRRPVT